MLRGDISDCSTQVVFLSCLDGCRCVSANANANAKASANAMIKQDSFMACFSIGR